MTKAGAPVSLLYPEIQVSLEIIGTSVKAVLWETSRNGARVSASLCPADLCELGEAFIKFGNKASRILDKEFRRRKTGDQKG